MIIVVPTEHDDINLEACAVFGRAPLLMFFDTDSKVFTFKVNPGVQAEGGAGPLAAQTLIDGKANVLLAGRVGQNAQTVLEAAHIKVYTSIEGTAQENIDAYLAGELSIAEKAFKGFRS